jgi:hypothetical protein
MRGGDHATTRFSGLVDGIPEYQGYLTVDELNENARELARQFPDRVRLLTIGHSESGEPILCLNIGRGSRSALLVGLPHPCEPVGSVMLDYLSRRFAEDPHLVEDLGYSWYMVKCIDPDGTRLNEGWFKGPFTLRQFAQHYYRGAYTDQVEWTFPVQYGDFHFDSPTAETSALMNLMQRVRPDFYFTLHNNYFSGVYFYVSHHAPTLYPRLYQAAAHWGLPLHQGEMEVPYRRRLAPAVYMMPGIGEAYDFYAKLGQSFSVARGGGGSSYDYLKMLRPDAFGLMCELGYFNDPRLADMSGARISRREAIMHSVRNGARIYDLLAAWNAEATPNLQLRSHLRRRIEEYLASAQTDLEAKRKWAEAAPELGEEATVAEALDNMEIQSFWQLLIVSMFRRMVDEEIATASGRARIALVEIHTRVLQEFELIATRLEKSTTYTSFPIRSLAGVQLICTLEGAQFVSDGFGDTEGTSR